MICRYRFLAPIIAALLIVALPPLACAKTNPPPPQGLVIRVVIIPPTAGVQPSELQPLADKINTSSLYKAWVSRQPCPWSGNSCDASDAWIFIHATKADTGWTLTSVNVVDGSAIDTLSAITDLSKMQSSQVTELLGSVSFVDGKIVIGHQYEQLVQVVAAQNSASDVDYFPVLKELLARRGITAERSQYTSVQLGNSPTATICNQGERYFVYSISTTNNPKPLTGFTRIGAKAAAYLADCPTRTTIPFAGEQHFDIPTTNESLLTYSAFLAFIIPKFAWVPIGQAELAFAKIVDVDPQSAIVRDDVATTALMRSIDNFCTTAQIIASVRQTGALNYTPATIPDATLPTLPNFTPFALPPVAPSAIEPRPPSESLNYSLKTGAASTTGAAAGAPSAGSPLDLLAFKGPVVPPLLCNPAIKQNPLVRP